LKQFETFAASRYGLRRMRLAKDGSGVHNELLCHFMGCVTHVILEEDKSLTLRVLARSCRRDRVVEVEISETAFRYPRRVHSILCGRGGIDFFIHPGNVAAVCRALHALSPAECREAENELLQRAAKPP
jgi:hypothetical protein